MPGSVSGHPGRPFGAGSSRLTPCKRPGGLLQCGRGEREKAPQRIHQGDRDQGADGVPLDRTALTGSERRRRTAGGRLVRRAQREPHHRQDQGAHAALRLEERHRHRCQFPDPPGYWHAFYMNRLAWVSWWMSWPSEKSRRPPPGPTCSIPPTRADPDALAPGLRNGLAVIMTWCRSMGRTRPMRP
jgi:hypothetical protein